MTAPELLALSLVLSVAVAALGLALMRAVERRIADPVLRERGWAATLYISVLPPVVVGLMLLTPAPLVTAPAASTATDATTVLMEVLGAAATAPVDLIHAAALAALALAGLMAIFGIATLGLRLFRLRRLIRTTHVASTELVSVVKGAAREIGAPVPAVRVRPTGAEALLAGLRRPVLILPAALADAPDSPTTRAVCAHELAHLKRGDHRALWIEEALLAVAACNPLLRHIRDHRAAAREEACDAAALSGTPDEQRRLYARALLEAVRASGVGQTAPALSFTSARRTFVMNRLKAVLDPAAPARAGSRHAVIGATALVAGLACAGSFAVAAQRQPTHAEASEDLGAVRQPTGAPLAEAGTVASVARPAPLPEVVPPAPSQPVAAAPAEAPAIVAAEQAQEPSPPTEISRVTWSRHPTPMYPAPAAANGVESGTVSLSCVVGADGSASDCTLLSETPEGQGFGEATLASMQTARFSPDVLERSAPGTRARFTIRFRLAE